MLSRLLTRLAIALLFLGGLLCSGSCGRVSRPGQVMLLISTDLAVPTDVDTLRVAVTRSGETAPFVDDQYPLRGEADVPPADRTSRYLPGTFALVSSDTMHGVVQVHLELRQGKDGAARVQRDAELEIPSEGVKQLPMALDFLCAEGNLAEDCAAGQTCQAGTCVDIKLVPSSELDDYVAAVPSMCFSVADCFGLITPANSVVPNKDSDLGCYVKSGLVVGAVDINVALVVNTAAVGNQGVCDLTVGKCLVPLEKGPEGWQTLYDPHDPKQAVGIRLPDAVCEQIRSNGKPVRASSVLSVAIFPSSRCGTKSASAALCPAPDACVMTSLICPPDWSGLSCGLASPVCEDKDKPCPWEFCGQLATDPKLGPTVPGLWCCTNVKPVQPDDPLLIDDMSSGPLIKIPPKSGLFPGNWFTASDDIIHPLFPPTAPYTLFAYRTIDPQETPSGGPTISHAACLHSDGFEGYYAQEGFNFYLNPDDYSDDSEVAFDVSGYTGISFWAKAAPSPFDYLQTEIHVLFPDGNTDSTPGVPATCQQGGGPEPTGGTPCDPFGKILTLTPDWTLYTIKWADPDLKQSGYGTAFPALDPHVYATNFQVNGSPGSLSLPFDFCIAQIEFTND